MEINAGNIAVLGTALNLALNKKIQTVETFYTNIAMTITSTSASSFYPRLLEIPGFREFAGSRVVHRLSIGDRMEIVNKDFEATFSIKVNDIKDNQAGFYGPVFEGIADSAAKLPDKLIFDLLEKGQKLTGMDGQYFFDTDHLVHDRQGNSAGFSNILRPDAAPDQGNSPAWYLFCTRQAIKPLIFQDREAISFTERADEKSGNVFNRREYEWGAFGRMAVGFGLHNFALRSTAPLTERNLATAVSMLENQFQRDGTPYDAFPDKLFVPSTLRSQAKTLLEKDYVLGLAPDGKTWLPVPNTWSGSMAATVCQYLDPISRND